MEPPMLAPSVPIERVPAPLTASPRLALAGGEREAAAVKGASSAPGFERAFDASAPVLYRFFAIRTGDTHVADDLMQQLWLAASTNGRVVPETELEFWLRGVARNLLATHWRSAKRATAGLKADPELARTIAERLESGALPQDVLTRREALDQLMLALTELSVEEHDLIAMRYFQRADLATMAARFGSSERAMEGRLYRARQALRERLKRME